MGEEKEEIEKVSKKGKDVKKKRLFLFEKDKKKMNKIEMQIRFI